MDATALVPPNTYFFPLSKMIQPVLESASPEISGTPLPTLPSGFALEGTLALDYQPGNGKKSLIHPPVALPGPLFHTTSPVESSFVPPHPVA